MKYKPQAPAEFVVARRIAARIQQFVLLSPAQRPRGEKGPQRAEVVRSKQTFPQNNSLKCLVWMI
jgi:hypothetical protein